jgi:hypothetical protein
MAYNRKYLLRKVIKIQALVIAGNKKGVSNKWVYYNEIADVYDISYDTFKRYVGINAKKELDELEKKEAAIRAEKARQKTIEFID